MKHITFSGPHSWCQYVSSNRHQMRDKLYCVILGFIMWRQLATRPDLSFEVSLLFQFQSDPGLEHWKVLLHVMGYVKNMQYFIVLSHSRWNPHGIVLFHEFHMDSIHSYHGFHTFPCGFHALSGGFHTLPGGFQIDSMQFHVDSTWIPCTSMWISYGFHKFYTLMIGTMIPPLANYDWPLDSLPGN